MDRVEEMCQKCGILHTNLDDMPKRKIDIEKLGKNPFLESLVIKCTKRIDDSKFVMDEEGIMLPASSVIEKQKAMKVFRFAGGKQQVMNLSGTALRMFVYIQYDAEKDYIEITPEQYSKAKIS